MRILQVNTSDVGGGAEGSAWNLFQAYRKRGHESWLAVGFKRSSDPDVLEIPRPKPSALRPRVYEGMARMITPMEAILPGVWRGRHWLNILASGPMGVDLELGREHFHYPGTYRLLRLSPSRPDIVHIHNLHGYYFDLRALPWLSRQAPVVLNLRDSWPLGGHCAHPLGCERWQTGCGRCPHLEVYPGLKRDGTAYNWRRKRAIYARSRLFVTTASQWLMDRVRKSMLSGADYRVIPNGIDLSVFCPGEKGAARRQLGLPADAKIVMMTAHNSWKDLSAMEAALASVSAPGPLLFVCIGKARDEKPLGQGHAIYPPFIKDPNVMAQYYRAADVFFLVSKEEAFGKTLVEAMACGVPVVAAAVGGVPEVVSDGEGGFLLEREDIAGMSRAIERLLRDDPLRAGISIAAAQRGRQFSLDKQADAFLAWYAEILACDVPKPGAIGNPSGKESAQ